MARPDTILVMRSPGETRYALLAGDELIEVLHRRDACIQPGAIYAGRILAGVPGVPAAFVEIGDALPGVMPVKGRMPPQGSAVAVTVIVPPRAGKGAELKPADVKVDGTAPRLLAPAPEPVTAWWNCYRDGIGDILASPRREAARVKALLPDAPVTEAPRGFFAVVDEAIEAALGPIVPLPSGGSIIIEHTAAVVAIDINSGASDPAQANSEAIAAVAAELRRRNIAGHILVDLIPSRRRSALVRALADALSPDPVSSNVAGITPLGMIELTRRRVGLSLLETLCDPDGRLSAASVGYRVLRDAVAFAHEAKAAGVRVAAAPDVVAAVQGPLQTALAEARDEIKGELHLAPRADFPHTRAEFAPA
jgi:Ribonuclease G/E